MNNMVLGRLCSLQIEARDKGLLILYGKKNSFLHAWNEFQETVELATDEIGYAVIKRYGDIDFTVYDDGSLNYEIYYDGLFENWTVWFHSTLEEAEQIVRNYHFNKSDASLPKFYGFIRIYEGENQCIYYETQRNLLETWAKNEGIDFKEIFVCRGGRPDYESPFSDKKQVMEFECPEAFENTYFSCEEIFDEMEESDVLCVTGQDRLDGDYQLWKHRCIINCIAEPIQHKVFDYRVCEPSAANIDSACPF